VQSRCGSVNATRLEQAVEAALAIEVPSPAPPVFDLYSASAFQPSADARFVMLVMAVESMLDLQPRPEEVVAAGLAAVAAVPVNRPGRQGSCGDSGEPYLPGHDSVEILRSLLRPPQQVGPPGNVTSRASRGGCRSAAVGAVRGRSSEPGTARYSARLRTRQVDGCENGWFTDSEP
jgi:hypothetical protein